jgi:diketogulonate reductase-like aldo/keto reductase
VPLAETMRALERLVDDGKIRSLGVSNFEIEDLEEARSLLERHPIVCNQVLYHLGERTIEEEEVPYCRSRGIAIVGYTPFGRGDWMDRAGLEVLERIARERQTTVRAVILAFLTRDDDLVTIPKASTVVHVEENARGGELRLDAAEITAIDAAFPRKKRRGGLPTL